MHELKRAIKSLLYELTDLSSHKALVLAAYAGTLAITDVIRSPYVPELL